MFALVWLSFYFVFHISYFASVCQWSPPMVITVCNYKIGQKLYAVLELIGNQPFHLFTHEEFVLNCSRKIGMKQINCNMSPNPNLNHVNFCHWSFANAKDAGLEGPDVERVVWVNINYKSRLCLKIIFLTSLIYALANTWVPYLEHFAVSLPLIQQSHCGAERQTVCVVLMLTFDTETTGVLLEQWQFMSVQSLFNINIDFLTQLHKWMWGTNIVLRWK